MWAGCLCVKNAFSFYSKTLARPLSATHTLPHSHHGLARPPPPPLILGAAIDNRGGEVGLAFFDAGRAR